MRFIDTNILLYAIINQIPEYHRQSIQLIEESIQHKHLALSPLVLSEFIYSSAKLKLPRELISKQ